MDQFSIWSTVGLLGAGACLAAYGYGYLLKRAAVRWLDILSLFWTTLALAQLSYVLSVGVPPGGSAEAALAMVFLVVAGLAQAFMALRARRAGEPRGDEPGAGRTPGA